MKKWVCSVCGYVYEGENPPEKCPQCGVPASKFTEQKGELSWAAEHVVGVGKSFGESVPAEVQKEIIDGLNANFTGECTEVGMYLAMSRVAYREGYAEIGEYWRRAALEEAEHAGATEVLGVYLTVGYSRDIVEDVFESMFAWMCRGTVAEGAVLHLTRVPFTVRCEECGRIFPVNTRCRDTPRCPQCGASHYRLHSGMEFYVNDIEVKTDPTAVRALAS